LFHFLLEHDNLFFLRPAFRPDKQGYRSLCGQCPTKLAREDIEALLIPNGARTGLFFCFDEPVAQVGVDDAMAFPHLIISCDFQHPLLLS